MKPLKTIDFVGLDVHKAIIENVYLNENNSFREEFILPKFVQNLIDDASLGKKSGKGLYKKENCVYDIANQCYREVKNYNNETINKINELIKCGKYKEAYIILLEDKSEKMESVKKILIEYIFYSIIIAKETAKDIEACDKVMSNGFGWCPPLALKDLLEEICDFELICKQYIDNKLIEEYNFFNILKNVPKSKYNYRKYIKST